MQKHICFNINWHQCTLMHVLPTPQMIPCLNFICMHACMCVCLCGAACIYANHKNTQNMHMPRALIAVEALQNGN